MHMEMIDDVKQGISMLAYLLAHSDEFTDTTIPFVLGLMQFSGGLLAELANLLMLATRQNIDSCINFFVAFHVLNAIDNIYVEAFSDFELLEATHETLLFKRRVREIEHKTAKHKAFHVMWWLIQFFFNTVYFYYFPFLANFVPYLSPGAVE